MIASSLAVVPHGSGACKSDEIAPEIVLDYEPNGPGAQKMSRYLIAELFHTQSNSTPLVTAPM
jgi:hypothetical protein